MRLKQVAFLLVSLLCVSSCDVKTKYTLTGANSPAKTFQVTYFQNHATQNPGSIIEPGMERDFTDALMDRILSRTKLELVNKGDANLLYEGEIIEYRISPTDATSQQTVARNRLSIGVAVRFFNRILKDADFEKRFSFFYDYPANAQLSSIKSEAHEVIFERITQDIFNESLVNW